MKILIASDLHGSALACRRLLSLYAAQGARRLLLLGDILYHGPRNPLPEEYAPQEVARMLNAHKREILCVRGNCDADVDQMMLEFPILADYCVLYANGQAVYATHGHVYTPDAPPPLAEGDVLLGGHTHVTARLERAGIMYLNPGSAALPKQGSVPGALLWEDGAFAFVNLAGQPVQPVMQG